MFETIYFWQAKRGHIRTEMTRETSGPKPEATRGCREERELTLQYSEMLPRYCACNNPYVSLGVKLNSTQSTAKNKQVHNLTSALPISIISTSSAESVGLSGEESEVDQVFNKNRKKYQHECNLNVNPSTQALFSQLCYDSGATICFFRLQQNVNLLQDKYIFIF